MRFNLHIWRQKNKDSKGKWSITTRSTILARTVLSLKCLTFSNEELSEKGEDPVVFDHDCREGICGSCSLMINE